jgi:hypothetical protein
MGKSKSILFFFLIFFFLVRRAMYIVEKQEWKMAFRLHTFALSTQALHHPPSSSLHLQGDSVGLFLLSPSLFSPLKLHPKKKEKREHWIHKSSTRMLIRRNTDGTCEDLHKKETFFLSLSYMKSYERLMRVYGK